MALYFGKTKETSRLGTLLVNKGAISDEQLEQALTYQQGKDLKLGEALIELGLIELKQLDKALCRQRWSRSLVASVMMIATPVCPVLASENSDDTQFNASSTVSITSDNYFQHNQTNEPKDKFLLGLAHKVSFSSGIEIGLGQANEMNNARFNRTAENNYIPQITLFTSTNQIVNQSYLGSGEKSLNRFDRSKNTSPAVYRLTLKGYALFEQDDKTVETFGFKRIDTPYKSFELMFSVTKQF